MPGMPWCSASQKRFGTGAAQDYRRASEMFEKACALADALGCNNLAFAYETGNGVPQDRLRALEFWEKGCDLGHASGCAALGDRYAAGTDFAQDWTRAVALYEKSCDLKSRWAARGSAQATKTAPVSTATAIGQNVCTKRRTRGSRNTAVAETVCHATAWLRGIKRGATASESMSNIE